MLKNDIMKYKTKINNPLSSKGQNIITDSDGIGKVCGFTFEPKMYPDIFDEIKEPLFVTEDGYELYENCIVYLPCLDDYCVYSNYLNSISEKNKKEMKIFKYEVSAREWIKENKPKFSEKQIYLSVEKCRTQAINNMIYINFIDFKSGLSL